MKRRLITFAALVVLAGCTPEIFTRPTIPNTPPARPGAFEGSEAKNRIPVTPAQITEQNVNQKLLDLESEMEVDARTPVPKS